VPLEEIVKVYRQGEQVVGDRPAAPLTASVQRTQALGSSAEPPTAKQMALLRSKNYEGQAPTTKREASQIIDGLMNA